MKLDDIPLFTALRARMAWLSERQKLLAENIANADTPGYLARDLKPVDFHQLVEKHSSGSGLTLTNVRHLRGGSAGQGFDFKPVENPGAEVKPSGNSVSIEQEMMKLGQTQMEYETATGLYRKHSMLLKLALGRNN